MQPVGLWMGHFGLKPICWRYVFDIAWEWPISGYHMGFLLLLLLILILAQLPQFRAGATRTNEGEVNTLGYGEETEAQKQAHQAANASWNKY